MATEADRLASIRANLLAIYDNATARGAELDAVPLDQRARMNYTDGDQTYGWNDFRAALAAREESAATRLENLQKIAGPYVVRSVAR